MKTSGRRQEWTGRQAIPAHVEPDCTWIILNELLRNSCAVLQVGFEFGHPVLLPMPKGMSGPPFQKMLPEMTRLTSAWTVAGSFTACKGRMGVGDGTYPYTPPPCLPPAPHGLPPGPSATPWCAVYLGQIRSKHVDLLPLALIPGRVEDHIVGDDDVVIGDVGGLHSGWGGGHRLDDDVVVGDVGGLHSGWGGGRHHLESYRGIWFREGQDA